MRLFSALLLLFTAGALVSCGQKIPVDALVYNGKIFTARGEQEFTEAMAIKDGIILAIGSKEALLDKYLPADTGGIDLQGRLALPGFHDAHLHFWNGAKLRRQIDLRGLTSPEAVLEKIQQAANQIPPGEWIIGRGWDHELWKSKQLPNRYLLDRISTEHLIYLKRVDGHAAWVNTAVMRLIRYDSKTPDPPGGKLMRYPGSTEPTGVLFDSAFDLVDNIIPKLTLTQKYEVVKEALSYANSLGITSITDNSPADLHAVYAELFKNGQLSLRVNFWIDYVDHLDSLRRHFSKSEAPPEFLKANLVKLYADGSLGSRTAYLQAPYNDDAANTGLPQYSFLDLFDRVKKSDEAGFQLGIHGIGDAGVGLILDVFQALQQQQPRENRRWRVEHAQMLDSLDFARFHRLGVIASMQPSHCITDMHWAERRIGKRARFSYAWNSFLQNDVPLAFGTDWPVEPLNPMVGLYAAITRQDTLGFPDGGWYPGERISLGNAIIAYTYGSAYAAKNESWCGTLQPGKAADFIILDRDIFSAAPEEVLHAKVLATYVDGKRVYKKEEGF